jgi:hypothetical protein
VIHMTCPFCLSDVKVGALVCSNCGASIEYRAKGEGLVGLAMFGGLCAGFLPAAFLFLFLLIFKNWAPNDAGLISILLMVFIFLLSTYPIYRSFKNGDAKLDDDDYEVTFSKGGSVQQYHGGGVGILIPLDND